MIRRAIGTTLAGLCALTGPLAGGAFAATTDADLTLSTSSARPGVAFTVSPTVSAAGCPSASGVQTVALTFTDHAGTAHAIGSVDTDATGTWVSASAQLPVVGLDDQGSWSNTSVAAGAGTLTAACFVSDTSTEPDEDTTDPGDDSTDPGDDSTDPGDDSTDPGDDSTEPGDDIGDPDDDASTAPTRTYTGIALTVTGSAATLALSASVLKPGGSVTVTPAEGCAATGVSVVQVALVSLSDSSDDGTGEEDSTGDDSGDDSGDDGDVDPGDDTTVDVSALPTASITTSATGTWAPVTLVLPADTETGDYAVTADCTTGDLVTSSYSAAPVAVGTVLIAPAVCGARTVAASLTGTYSGDIAVGKDDVTLPAKLALTGDGPWKIRLHSATTGQLIASRTLACAKPRYDIEVLRTGLSKSGKAQARVCNTGRATATAVLQVLANKKYQKVDKESLDPGECVWLEGGRVGKGDQVRAQVLIDAPGKGSDDVTESFTVKRGKR